MSGMRGVRREVLNGTNTSLLVSRPMNIDASVRDSSSPTTTNRRPLIRIESPMGSRPSRSFACALIFLEVRTIMVLFQLPEQFVETVVWGCVAGAYPIADLILQIDQSMQARARPARA